MNLTTIEIYIAENLHNKKASLKGYKGVYKYETGKAIYPYPHETHDLYFYVSNEDIIFHLNYFDFEEILKIARRNKIDLSQFESNKEGKGN